MLAFQQVRAPTDASGEPAIATVRVVAGGAPVVRFALTAFGKALVRAHHGKAFDVTLLVKTSFGNRLVRRIALG